MTFATYPSLDGASVYITGGASGIGAEIVKAFANQNSKIGFIDFDHTKKIFFRTKKSIFKINFISWV